MIDIIDNCIDSLNIYLILFIAFVLYLINKKSRNDKLRKVIILKRLIIFQFIHNSSNQGRGRRDRRIN